MRSEKTERRIGRTTSSDWNTLSRTAILSPNQTAVEGPQPFITLPHADQPVYSAFVFPQVSLLPIVRHALSALRPRRPRVDRPANSGLLDGCARVWGIDHLPPADVDAHVLDGRVEEHEVAGLKRRPRDVRKRRVLLGRVVRK